MFDFLFTDRTKKILDTEENDRKINMSLIEYAEHRKNMSANNTPDEHRLEMSKQEANRIENKRLRDCAERIAFNMNSPWKVMDDLNIATANQFMPRRKKWHEVKFTSRKGRLL